MDLHLTPPIFEFSKEKSKLKFFIYRIEKTKKLKVMSKSMNDYVSKSMHNISSRLVYADILRIVAIFAIVIIHLSTGALYGGTPGSMAWNISLLFDSLFNWGTLVFIMLSGLFMLRPEKISSLKHFYLGRLKRILIPFIIWAVIYELIRIGFSSEGYTFYSIVDIGKRLIEGQVQVHLWFIYMLIAMYLITPVLSRFANSATKNELIFYYAVWAIGLVVLPILKRYFSLGNGVTPYLDLNSYAGFYMLGYVLQKYELKIKKTWFILLPVLIALKFIMVYMTSMDAEHTVHFYRNRLSFNIIPIPILVFMLFKQINWSKIFPRKSYQYRLMVKYSALSYGIFLCHWLVLDTFKKGYLGFTITPYSVLGVELPIYFAFPIFILSIMIVIVVFVQLINRIPILNKLLL